MYYADRVVIKDRREMLRVKAKSLAEETRIIQREERRTNGDLLCELRSHRTRVVRYEARATFLAYGLIRGKTMNQIERPNSTRTPELLAKVAGMISRYGPTNPEERAKLLESCK